LSGFISGEGNFYIFVADSKTSKIGQQVIYKFRITQHYRDVQLIKSFIKYLNCGRLETDTKIVNYTCSKLSEILDFIIPFINKYQIYGVKALDFKCFCNIIELIKNKEHLTSEGLAKIIEIKNKMNRNRS